MQEQQLSIVVITHPTLATAQQRRSSCKNIGALRFERIPSRRCVAGNGISDNVTSSPALYCVKTAAGPFLFFDIGQRYASPTTFRSL
jgi:hypothetical protein